MTKNELRDYCCSIKGATDTSSGGENMFIIKVMDKIFAYTEDKLPQGEPFTIMLKCNPEKAIELRSQYEGITTPKGAFAKAWNKVELESDVPDDIIKELVNHSVMEVIKALPKKQRDAYNSL